jgi:hypothetical protein
MSALYNTNLAAQYYPKLRSENTEKEKTKAKESKDRIKSVP